jgi:MFS family permease
MNPEPLHPAASSAGTTGASAIGLRDFLRLFSAVMLPMFLASVDQTLLATATPAIAREFGALANSSWVALGYLIASAVMIPLYGRLGDAIGYRRLLATALGAFLFGCALGGFAPTLEWLVAARVLQGLGGGGLMVMSQALIGELVPPRERPRFQGWFAAVFTLASLAGPVLGGMVVHAAGWRWLFWGLLPLGAVALWRVLSLPEDSRPATTLPAFDVAGIGGFATATVLGLTWISFAGKRFAWDSPTSLALAVATLATWTLLISHQRRQRHALLPLELLRLPGAAAQAATVSIFAGSLFALVFFLPIYLQLGRGRSALDAGLGLLPLTLGVAAGAMATARFIARTGKVGVLPPFGLLLSAMAVAVLALAPPVDAVLMSATVLCGLGLGSVMPNAQMVVQTLAGRARLGAASALVSLARAAGSIIGTAVFGALLFGQLQSAGVGVQAIESAMSASPEAALRVLHAFHSSFAVLAAVLLYGAWIATRVPDIDLAPDAAKPVGLEP